jgi:hypothetical protein
VRVAQAGLTVPAVAGQLERGVRLHCEAKCVERGTEPEAWAIAQLDTYYLESSRQPLTAKRRRNHPPPSQTASMTQNHSGLFDQMSTPDERLLMIGTSPVQTPSPNMYKQKRPRVAMSK